jgi:hypothetical protein
MGRLRRFLPPQVADLIVASGTEKQLESHRREITALFCAGFTSVKHGVKTHRFWCCAERARAFVLCVKDEAGACSYSCHCERIDRVGRSPMAVEAHSFDNDWNSRTRRLFSVRQPAMEETMPRIKVADGPSMEGAPRKQVDFSKAQGSSRNDEADLRDVARKAAKKSQVHRQRDDEPRKKARQ